MLWILGGIEFDREKVEGYISGLVRSSALVIFYLTFFFRFIFFPLFFFFIQTENS
jgi:hypothetical protein